MVGTSIGHYHILASIGTGGMGEVYAAEDTRLGRRVALKVLLRGLAMDADRRERFEREARAVAALNHPNIVTIYSVEEADGVPFLTLEFVEGRTLDALIPQGGLPLDRILAYSIPLADAVGAAHQRGITHRDLKPGNVMIGDDGRVKVLDFGLAKLKESNASLAASLPTQELTGEGRIVGTVAYMSPEQAEAKPVDPRSDVFSLGVVIFEMATSQRPFKGDTQVSLLSSIIKDTPSSLTDLRSRAAARSRAHRQALPEQGSRRSLSDRQRSSQRPARAERGSLVWCGRRRHVRRPCSPCWSSSRETAVRDDGRRRHRGALGCRGRIRVLVG